MGSLMFKTLGKFTGKIIKRSPDTPFTFFVDLYYTVSFTKGARHVRALGGAKIEKYQNCWLIKKGGITLFSPTPKLVWGLNTLKQFEDKFERFFKIEEGFTVLDVGACIGDTTVPMAIKTGSKGIIIAVEPEPNNARFLKANLSKFPNVWIVEKAAWNREETIRFYINQSIMGHSIIDKTKNYVDVPADTLDNIVKTWDRIDFAKIDVQGAELQTLEGAEEMLKKTRKIVVETHYFGTYALYPKVSTFLKKRGFTVRVTPDRVVHAWK